jgi:hypothetical protein
MQNIKIKTTGLLMLPAACCSILELPVCYIGAPLYFAHRHLSTRKSVQDVLTF